MPRIKHTPLTKRAVDKLIRDNSLGVHALGGIPGFSLQIKSESNKSYILRIQRNGKRLTIGLGSCKDYTLAEAKAKAEELRQKMRDGDYNPINEKRQRISQAKRKQANEKTFKELGDAYIKKRSGEFKTEQQLRKLQRMFENYAYPAIGNMLITEIDLNTVKNILAPMWETKTETANRLRIYIGHVFDSAIASGAYKELNPARWEGGLKTQLAAPRKVNKVQHRASLPVESLPEFWAKLTQQDWQAAKVLQFGILTASRSSEMRGAKWSEIDYDEKVWRIPGERMKSGKPHNVPLSKAALSLLASQIKESEYIFPNSKGAPLADASISKVPKRLGYEVTTHGFRSTFKDWVRQPKKYSHEQYADELSELALAHVNNDATRAAYARNELLGERRPMMEEWAEYCQQRLHNVVKLVEA